MGISASRRSLLRGRPSRNDGAIRPPWALAEDAFIQACTRCGDCTPACPERIVLVGDGGYPEIDFSKGECTFCGDCVDACKDKALVRQEDAQPWDVTAVLAKEKCLSEQGVTCRVCGDICEVRAIKFTLAVGGLAFVDINQGTCTGCGACFQPCPVGAIRIRAQKEQEP